MEKVAKVGRTTSRAMFNSIVRDIEDSINNGEKSDVVLKTKKNALQSAFDQVVNSNQKYLELLEEDSVEFNKGVDYVTQIQTELSTILTVLDRYLVGLAPSTSKPTKAAVKCKQLELKKFDNDIRHYPSWRNTFTTYFQEAYGEHAGIVLKDALSGEADDLVHAIDDSDVEAILSALDERFGNQQKLVNSIIAGIESLPVCVPGNVEMLRTLFRTVKLARQDLKVIKLESEIEHSSTVKIIERKLTPTLKISWAKYKHEKKVILASKLFDSLMKFLDQELQCAEDVETMGTPVPVLPHGSYSALPQPPSLGTSNVQLPLPTYGQNPPRQMPPPDNQDQKQPRGDPPKNSGNRFCTVHDTHGKHWPRWCQLLRRKSVADQVKWFKTTGKDCCRLCVGRGHGTDGSKCPIKNYKECGKNGCKKNHMNDFHDAFEILRQEEKPGSGTNVYAMPKVTTSSGSTVSPGSGYLSTLSPAQTAYTTSTANPLPLGVLIDTGSVVTLVHNRLVRHANLPRASDEQYDLTMETVGGDIHSYKAYAYRLEIRGHSTDKPPTTVTALGVDSIGSPFPVIDMKQAASIFNVEAESLDYPSGRNLDLLVGMDNASLALSNLANVDGLLLAENSLGKVVYGCHPSFVRPSLPRHYRVTCYSLANTTIPDLCATDILGVECTPKCGGCRCGKCTPGSGHLSLKEEREYQLIKDGMKLDGNRVVAKYPWIKSPSELPDNYSLAFKRLIQTERRLRKDPQAAAKYEEQIQDLLDRGVARKLSTAEDADWKSNPLHPVQYLPHHEVLKPSSKSTPVRIVFDPSSEFQGHAVNQYWGTGPNLICNALGLQLRFRENMTAVIADVSKMYQTVLTTPMEWHCHRFLWRGFDATKEPDIFIIVRNSFGSRPAGAVAIAAMHLVADAGSEQYPIGARTIRDQSYVDDILDSTETKTEAQELTRQTDLCLALGSFKVKGWTVVDARDVTEPSPPVVSSDRQIGGSEELVLGTFWDMSTDSFVLKARINFSKRKKKIRQGPDLKINEIFLMTEPLTLRSVLSQVNGYYDPMGLVGPYITELKFQLGQLWKAVRSESTDNAIVWDRPIPPDHDDTWKSLLNTAFLVESITFPRHLKPDNSVGKPWLILFSDSSMRAFGCCAYIRWTLKDKSVWGRLIASKSRIWPLDSSDFLSMCRGELQGAVLAKRLGQTILKEMRFSFEKVVYIVDSEIVRAQIGKDSHAFDVFVGNRVGEIRAKTSPDQWFHAPGSENVSADLLSRGSTDVTTMDRKSAWQNGPTFIYKRFDEWPITQRRVTDSPLPGLRDKSLRPAMTVQLPSVPCPDPYGDCAWSDLVTAYSTMVADDREPRVVRTKFDDATEDAIAECIEVGRFSKLQTLLSATYRILHVLAWRPGDGHFVRFMSTVRVVDAEQLELALQFWLRHTQRPLHDSIKKGKFVRLNPALDESTGIYRLNGRFGTHPQGYHPVLLPRSEFSTLLVSSIHRRAHGGATNTAAKVRSHYHIIGLKKLAMAVRKDCTLCRKIEKRLLKATMAPLPSERFRPAYAFEHCSCDVFGNFLLQVPGQVTRGRPMAAYGKGYGVIFTCLSTRAIHLEAMEGQDTSAFLLCLRRFISLRGQPRFMWSDNGKQIVAADEELKNVVSTWDDDELRKFGATNGIKWQYIAPGSPWQNGVSEALIKSVKRSLAALYHNRARIPIMELQTVLTEVAAILNERPINLGHSEIPGDWDIDVNTYLCPNHLLLGRSSIRIPAGPFGTTSVPHAQQFHNVQTIVNEWWELWKTHYLPTLLTRSKWHTQDRSVAVGDIVYVRDTNAVRGQWQIAEVIRAEPSASDGLVRHVEVRYKRLPDGPTHVYTGTPDKTEIRDVKNLCVLITAEERKSERK